MISPPFELSDLVSNGFVGRDTGRLQITRNLEDFGVAINFYVLQGSGKSIPSEVINGLQALAKDMPDSPYCTVSRSYAYKRGVTYDNFYVFIKEKDLQQAKENITKGALAPAAESKENKDAKAIEALVATSFLSTQSSSTPQGKAAAAATNSRCVVM